MIVIILIISPVLFLNNSNLTEIHYHWGIFSFFHVLMPHFCLLKCCWTPPLSFLSAAVSELVPQCLPERRGRTRRGRRGVIRLGGGNSEIWWRGRQAFWHSHLPACALIYNGNRSWQRAALNRTHHKYTENSTTKSYMIFNPRNSQLQSSVHYSVW